MVSMRQAVYIGEVASSVGLTPQAIRFYERLGIIEKAERTNAGYRVYSVATLERVRFIKQAQMLGFSLEEIREVQRVKYSGQSPCDCVREMLKQKLLGLKKQIAEMEKVRQETESCLRASRRLIRLPHEASLICPLIQKQTSLRGKQTRRKGGEKR